MFSVSSNKREFINEHNGYSSMRPTKFSEYLASPVLKIHYRLTFMTLVWIHHSKASWNAQTCTWIHTKTISINAAGCCCLVAKSCQPLSWLHGLQLAMLLHPWDFPWKILELVAISFYRGSYRPIDRTYVSCLAGRFFTTEPPGKPSPLLLLGYN